ncbi:hypothetical protein ABW19_dt0205928 [Dactylella cylindrospora]|nr:hypothetical protein ABW19_dt0205928 [Dactylella cylindrospora]
MSASPIPISKMSAESGMATPKTAQEVEDQIVSIPTSTESSPVNIEPLHQGTSAENLENQRKLLQQKLAEHAANAEKFVSPTDNMMSPCSQKLAAQKKKQYGKSKPTLLKSAFAQVAADQGTKASRKRDEDSPF